MRHTNFIVLLFIALATISCSNDEEENSKTFTYRFTNNAEGWTGSFADYPVGEEEFYELKSEYAKLPAPLNASEGSFMISGNNHSDDLFMFIKRQAEGLKPNTTYEVTFDIEFASNAATNVMGVGGAPGESVCMKIGAVATEPGRKVEDDYYRMNIDKSNQSDPGEAMDTIGHVGVSDTTTVFTLIGRNNKLHPVKATTDNTGKIWVIIGTDSGFEATTTLYYHRIEIIFEEKED